MPSNNLTFRLNFLFESGVQLLCLPRLASQQTADMTTALSAIPSRILYLAENLNLLRHIKYLTQNLQTPPCPRGVFHHPYGNRQTLPVFSHS